MTGVIWFFLGFSVCLWLMLLLGVLATAALDCPTLEEKQKDEHGHPD